MATQNTQATANITSDAAKVSPKVWAQSLNRPLLPKPAVKITHFIDPSEATWEFTRTVDTAGGADAHELSSDSEEDTEDEEREESIEDIERDFNAFIADHVRENAHMAECVHDCTNNMDDYECENKRHNHYVCPPDCPGRDDDAPSSDELAECDEINEEYNAHLDKCLRDDDDESMDEAEDSPGSTSEEGSEAESESDTIILDHVKQGIELEERERNSAKALVDKIKISRIRENYERMEVEKESKAIYAKSTMPPITPERFRKPFQPVRFKDNEYDISDGDISPNQNIIRTSAGGVRRQLGHNIGTKPAYILNLGKADGEIQRVKVVKATAERRGVRPDCSAILSCMYPEWFQRDAPSALEAALDEKGQSMVAEIDTGIRKHAAQLRRMMLAREFVISHAPK